MAESAPDALTRVHRDLVRSAVNARGPRGIAEKLTAVLGGWLLLIDERGGLRAAVPETAREHLARVLAEMPRRDSDGSPTTMSIALPDEVVAIRAVIVGGRVRGHIAVGRPTPLSPAEHVLVETATYLLAEDMRRTDEVHDEVRSSRLAVMRLLLAGHDDLARSTGAILRVVVPSGDVRTAMLVTSAEHASLLLDEVETDPALRRIDTLSGALAPGRVGIVLPTAEGDLRTLEAVLRRVPNGRGAVSDAVPVPSLPEAWRRMQDVFDASSGRRGKLLVAGDVVEAGLLRHLTGDDVQAWAQAAIQPILALNDGSKVDFARTLIAYLSNNGQADSSAKQLGIHRHTLRYRMNRIEEAVGRELDDPTVRAELWLAFKMSSVY